MSSEPLQDPLDILSCEMVQIIGPIRGIDTRIGQEINKHSYEICLKEIYFRTVHWFKGKRHIYHYHRKKHLFKLKQDIIHHCLANDLDPLDHLEEGSWGNFIVMPEIESSIYFGMLANRLYITPSYEVRTFLEFHSIHWKLVNDGSPQPSGYFLKNLNFLVMYLPSSELGPNAPFQKKPIVAPLVPDRKNEIGFRIRVYGVESFQDISLANEAGDVKFFMYHNKTAIKDGGSAQYFKPGGGGSDA